MIISQVVKSSKLLLNFIPQYLLCICYNDGYCICYDDGYCICYNDGYCICYNDGYCICYNDGELYSVIHFDNKCCVLLGIFPKFLLQL